MNQTNHRLYHIVITTVIMALLLTGAVPSFAWGPAPQPVYAEESDSEILPAIDIDYSDAPSIHSKCAVIMDVDTGTILFEKRPDKVVEPASVTKILNCLVSLEHLDMDQVITVPEEVESSGSLMWIDPGEKLTAEDLFYGMMLESGNDAAQVLGLTVADGDMDKFCEMMNDRARECGAQNTDFKNPNGLNEDPEHLNYTTARDLALISREAMKKPQFRKIVSSAKYTVPKTNKHKKKKIYNTNLCLWQEYQYTEVGGETIPLKYDGCNGIKTGFTSDAGFCYVGSAQRGETGFLVVTLGAEDSEKRYQDAIRLWNYAFDKYETYKVQQAGDTAGVNRVWAGEKRYVNVGTQRDLGVTIQKGTAGAQDFTTEFRLDNDKVTAPISKGQKLGQALVFNSKGRLVAREDLYALASVAEGGPLSHIGIADEDLPTAAAIAGGVLLLLFLILLIRYLIRKRARNRRRENMRDELSTMRTAGVGMTARELTDVTGVEEAVPIPRGPARISSEELTAWSSTSEKGSKKTGKKEGRRRGDKRAARKQEKDRRGAERGMSRGSGQSDPSRRGTENPAGRKDSPRRSGSRFGGGTPRGGYGDGQTARPASPGAPNASKAPHMKITPRTPFDTGAYGGSPSAGASGARNRYDASGSRGASGASGYHSTSGNSGYRSTSGSSGYHATSGGAGSRDLSRTLDAGRRQSRRPLSDEELTAMLDSTEVYDANQPRRHGKLSREEMSGVMDVPRSGSPEEGSRNDAAARLRSRRRRRKK